MNSTLPMRPGWRLLACTLAATLSACAPMIPSEPVAFKPTRADASELVLRAATVIDVPNEYTRTLPAGSHWRHAGTVPAGEVWRPVGFVFTVEGRQVHEAWLVMSGRALVGFYLSGETRYSSLPHPISLTLGDTN